MMPPAQKPSLKLAAIARDARRPAVLQTAARLFCERGFPNTSLDDIAETLGVTKPTLYFYFKNKDEILFECVRLGLARIDGAIDVTDSSDAVARLRAALLRYGEVMMEDFGRCLTLTAEYELHGTSQRKLRDAKRRIDSRLRQLIADGIAQGAIRDGDPKWIAFTLAGALNWIPRWYDPARAENAAGLAETLVDTLLRGILVTGQEESLPA